MKTLKELLARMEALLPEITDLSGKSQTTEDETKRAGYAAVMAEKKAEFDECAKRVESLKSEALMAKTIAEAKALMVPDAGAFNANPDGQPGAKAVGSLLPDGKTAPRPEGDTFFFEGKTIDMRQGANRIYKAKREAFLRMITAHPGNAMDGKRGLAALSGEEAKLIRAKDARFTQGKNALRDPVLIPEAMAHQILGLSGKVMLSSDATGYSTDSGSANLIDPNFIPQLIQEPQVIPAFWDLATRVPAANGRWDYPKRDTSAGRFGGVSLTWQTTEGATKIETTPYYTEFTGSTYELAAMVYASKINLSRSAINLEGDITQMLRDAARYELSRKMIYGTGSSQPTGILQDAALATVPRTLADAVDWPDIVNLTFTLTQGFRMGGKFIMDDSVEKHTNGKLDNTGRPIYTPGTPNGPVTRLNNYDYITHEYGASETTPLVLGDQGDIIFGNPAWYAAAVEQEIAIESSEHYLFHQGRVAIRAMLFAGGKPIYGDAFAVLSAAA